MNNTYTILVIDDEEQWCSTYKQELSNQELYNFQFEHVTNGLDAIERLKNKGASVVNCILLDQSFEKEVDYNKLFKDEEGNVYQNDNELEGYESLMQGVLIFEVLKKKMENVEIPEIPIIFCTAYWSEAFQRFWKKVQKKGGKDFLDKSKIAAGTDYLKRTIYKAMNLSCLPSDREIVEDICNAENVDFSCIEPLVTQEMKKWKRQRQRILKKVITKLKEKSHTSGGKSLTFTPDEITKAIGQVKKENSTEEITIDGWEIFLNTKLSGKYRDITFWLKDEISYIFRAVESLTGEKRIIRLLDYSSGFLSLEKNLDEKLTESRKFILIDSPYVSKLYACEKIEIGAEDPYLGIDSIVFFVEEDIRDDFLSGRGYLNKFNGFPLAVVNQIKEYFAKVMENINKKNLLHGYLNPENIWIKFDNSGLKLDDFKINCWGIYPFLNQSKISSPYFRQSTSQDNQDKYAFAVITHEMISEILSPPSSPLEDIEKLNNELIEKEEKKPKILKLGTLASNLEKEVFKNLEGLPFDYIILCNGRFQKPNTSVWREIDAIVIGGNGVCVLEVKGVAPGKNFTLDIAKEAIRQVVDNKYIIMEILREKFTGEIPCYVDAKVVTHDGIQIPGWVDDEQNFIIQLSKLSDYLMRTGHRELDNNTRKKIRDVLEETGTINPLEVGRNFEGFTIEHLLRKKEYLHVFKASQKRGKITHNFLIKEHDFSFLKPAERIKEFTLINRGPCIEREYLLKHPNVLIHDQYRKLDNQYESIKGVDARICLEVFMDCEYETLEDYIEEIKNLAWEQKFYTSIKLINQLISGLEYLHSEYISIAHRNICPENIAVNIDEQHKPVAKIYNFNWVATKEGISAIGLLNESYAMPNLSNCSTLSDCMKADIYSLGKVFRRLLELLPESPDEYQSSIRIIKETANKMCSQNLNEIPKLNDISKAMKTLSDYWSLASGNLI